MFSVSQRILLSHFSLVGRSDGNLAPCECQDSQHPPLGIISLGRVSHGRKSQSWSCHVPLELGKQDRDLKASWRPATKLGTLLRSCPVCLSGALEKLRKTGSLPGESALSFHFSWSFFPWRYFSQSPGYRKRVPPFLWHMASIPTGEKEAVFYGYGSPTSPHVNVIYNTHTPTKLI